MNVQEKAHQWMSENIDEGMKQEIAEMIENDPEQLAECFYTDLEFGTGGMRGIMGPGTNRINIYTIGMATQGLCNYLRKSFPDQTIKVAIAHDSRNNSDLFARRTAEVFSANGIEVYLFSALRPTPELSYAVRELGCKSGIVITASHNPKEYNGYKVYWDDGAQIVAPHDQGIIDEVRAIGDLSAIKTTVNSTLIHSIDETIDAPYIKAVVGLSLSPDVIVAQSDLGIAYTALHGTGITLIPQVLQEVGFKNVHLIKPQDIPNGNFPTVASPNPEEEAALSMAIGYASAHELDIVLGTDPDTDRVGIAVRNDDGQFQLLNGNQTGALIVYYHLLRWKELDKLKGAEFIAKTIVTTELIADIAKGFDTPVYDTLTGFKYIAAQIRALEGQKQFIAGGEESFGYLAGDFVRDKDAVISSMILCEIAAWCKNQGKTMTQMLEEIHRAFGFYQEKLISIKKEGKAGKEEIASMMERFRTNTPAQMGGEQIIRLDDVRSGISRDIINNKEESLDLPSSNVIQFFTEKGSKITARPSGTEPKIKFYISVKAEILERHSYAEVSAILNERIARIESDLMAI